MRWAQTDPESCGAASLMVALSEAGIGDLSRDREMELWERIRASGQYPGSIPGKIAVEAARQGLSPRLWVDPERIAVAREALGGLAAFDVPTLLAEHARGLAAARAGGVPVEERLTDGRAMVQAMRDGASLMAGFVIFLPDGKITLHWRLYRFVGNAIWEMDPDGAQEAPKTENQIVDLLAGQTYIGVAVSMRRP